MGYLMGLQVIIPGLTFTDTSLPIFYEEPLLTEGSLILYDPTHPHKIYETGDTLPNIAGKKVNSLVSGNTDANIINSQMSGANGKIEKTSKGGIHAIISESPDLNSIVAYEINLPDQIRDYILTNVNHKFYVSLWHRVTRAQANSIRRNFGGYTHNDVNYLWVFDAQGDLPASGSTQYIGAHQTASGKENGNAYRSLAVQGATNGWGNISTPDGKAVFRVGQNSNWNYGEGNQGAYPSQIFYRAYIEDLTVSGRTFEQVDALDYSLYVKEVLTEGGRYYGDTFTDPVAIP